MILSEGVPDIAELFNFSPGFLGFSYAVYAMAVAFVIVSAFMLLAFRGAPKPVPGRLAMLGESIVGFVRSGIAEEVIGHDGARYLPYLTTLFLLILGFNLMEIFPGVSFPPSSKIAVPMFLAIVSYLVFNFEGIRTQGPGKYFKEILFPPGVPWPFYVLLTPIELLSILVIRPVTLTLRLTFNMVAGHLILSLLAVLAGSMFIASPKVLALPLVIGFGAVMTGFEIFVAFLQAFIFTVLTALYIGGAVHPEH
ncbi:MAG: F0F1 ATP synthase subunit A [Mycobacteriales bacterium]|nr:F0F1 ATP synthase subunit A [Frankia sp.]